MMRLIWTGAFSVIIVVLVAGCGRDLPIKSVTVRGKVVGRPGKSVGPAAVIFWPENSKKNPGGTAACETDGSFSLECLPGKYRVTVSPIRPKGATAPPPPQGSEARIPTKYQNALSTPLIVNVPETGADNIILNLH
jgi:hypothetical protein